MLNVIRHYFDHGLLQNKYILLIRFDKIGQINVSFSFLKLEKSRYKERFLLMKPHSPLLDCKLQLTMN